MAHSTGNKVPSLSAGCSKIIVASLLNFWHMLDKLKDLYNLQKQAREIQSRLAGERVEGTSRDSSFCVELNGNQEVLSVSVSENANLSREVVERNAKEAFSDALSKLKNLLASKMREMM